MISLRDYQQECVKRVIDAYKENTSSKELIVLPTGGGKTIIFGAIIDTLAREYGLMALVVAHRDELLQQAADKYRLFKPEAIIGKVGSGVFEYGGEVTVAGVATISRPNHINQLQILHGSGKGLIVVIDEAHHVAADGYQRILEALPDAFVLMVTATPDRLDGKPILSKPPIYTRNIIDMITEGYLCNAKAIAIKTTVDLNKIHTQMGDFNQSELDAVVNTPARNALIVEKYQEHANGKRAVAFCVTTAHAEALAYAFNDAGVSAAVITGATPLLERQQIYKDFHDGKILILCNVMVLTEGWDEPLCEVAIMARPTQSRALYTQQFGRILRLAPGKECAFLLDITDNCTNHRLVPQSLRKILNKNLKEEESLLDALAREEEEREKKRKREEASRTAEECKLKEKRVKDIQINLLEKLEWVELPTGGFVMEVGRKKHRIAILPVKDSPGWFYVAARMAPNFDAAQKWSSMLSLDECQVIAEKKARLLYDGKKEWVDKNNPRRLKPITENQKKMLNWLKIPHGEGTTVLSFGEASDAIDAHKAEIEARKQATAKRKAQKEA